MPESIDLFGDMPSASGMPVARGDDDDISYIEEIPASGDLRRPHLALPSEPSREARLTAIKSARNPLLEAAKYLLGALRMPEVLDEEGVDVFHRLLTREVSVFQTLCTAARIKHEYIVAASYALCTAIDEAANLTPWGGGKEQQPGIWSGRQLAHCFHKDAEGGEKVFLLVGRLATSPHEHIDLIELLYFILSLGFEGRYRMAADGSRQLAMIRQRLYDIVVAQRGPVSNELSPNWKGVGAGRLQMMRGIPVWVTASLLSVVLLVMFAWIKHELVAESDRVEAAIRALGAPRVPEVQADR